ncbi:MAG: histidine phosphatase family protein [Propionibacteriaceae bacterium]|nr:histidine phosphatase family protein [Propionibacteriaceae bacterium]
MSSATKLVLWRHGVTDWNERGIFQGQTDIPLNERGLQQAGAAAQYVAEFSPSAIYCSPMRRAQQTAAALAVLTGLQPCVDNRLAEINVGTWTGRTLADAAGDDPAVMAAVRAGVDYRRSPTGETMTEVGQRAGQCLRELGKAHDGETIVVVSHGGAIRMGIANLLGWPHETATSLSGMPNCAWSVVAERAARWRLETYGCSWGTGRSSGNTEI